MNHNEIAKTVNDLRVAFDTCFWDESEVNHYQVIYEALEVITYLVDRMPEGEDIKRRAKR